MNFNHQKIKDIDWSDSDPDEGFTSWEEMDDIQIYNYLKDHGHDPRKFLI